MRPIGEPTAILSGHPETIGYEHTGEDGMGAAAPWIEGAFVTKYNGRYYMQYAAPGTEFNTYANGVYVSNAPLGPYTLAANNPFSMVPDGFANGAGHGSTLALANVRFVHTATMRISMNQPFERRLGLWKTGFDPEGELFCDQRYADWPIDLDTPHGLNHGGCCFPMAKVFVRPLEQMLPVLWTKTSALGGVLPATDLANGWKSTWNKWIGFMPFK